MSNRFTIYMIMDYSSSIIYDKNLFIALNLLRSFRVDLLNLNSRYKSQVYFVYNGGITENLNYTRLTFSCVIKYTAKVAHTIYSKF